MTTCQPTLPRTHDLAGPVLAVVLVLAALALGGWRVASAVTPPPSSTALSVGGVVYQVMHVEQVAGLSEADLAGVSHNIAGLVRDDKALITVSVVVSSSHRPATYDPSLLRVFDAGSDRRWAPVGGTLSRGRLSADARVEGSVSFVVPRRGVRLVLDTTSSGRRDHSVPLISVDDAPAGAGEHTHGHQGPLPSAGASSTGPTP